MTLPTSRLAIHIDNIIYKFEKNETKINKLCHLILKSINFSLNLLLLHVNYILSFCPFEK